MEPIKLILASNSWSNFLRNLSEMGNSGEVRKVKGDAFEFLTKFFLLTDPIFLSLFNDVIHHTELTITQRDHLKLPHPEVGVDLIGTYKDGTYCAIQCKFHQNREENVSYDELKTFFSVTERQETYSKLSHRLICVSTDQVSNTVTKIHKEKLGFLTYSDFSILDEERFDAIHKILKGDRLSFPLLKPRNHQISAISKSDNYFVTNALNRGKIIHPCGSGKSLTAYWIAKDQEARSVLLAVPSLALVRQTLSAWAKQALADNTEIDYMAVCSDKDVDQIDAATMSVHDLGIRSTTDPDLISKFILSPGKSLKLLVTTYQSGPAIIAAVKRTNHIFDIGFFDEAHKTTGDKTKRFALLLDDDQIAIQKKVFLTATERQFIGDSNNILSMDNETVYGRIIDQMSFRKALEQKPAVLCDYKVITIRVSKAEIERLIIANEFTKASGQKFSFSEDAATIASLIAFRKLSREKGIKHAISFHKSIKRAKEFTDLNNSLDKFLDEKEEISAFHVSGKMSMGERHLQIEKFLGASPSVISNARCLTEGVDLPAVDAVIFADPKQSLIDIVQASGRAMRTHGSKKLGYIIIPVVINNEGTDKVDDSFKQLINVIAALGMNDERIIDEVKNYIKSRGKLKGDIINFEDYIPQSEIELEEFIKEINLKMWDRLSFAKSVVGESEFKKWMEKNTDLSDASMEKYTRAVRKISNDLIKLNLAFSSLEEITKQTDLQELKDEYFSIEEYRDLDTRGNRMYSAGFNRLIEFQNFQRANVK